MITIDITKLVEICGVIIAVGGAMVWIWKATKPLRQPLETLQENMGTINKRMDTAEERLGKLEEIAEKNNEAIDVLIKTQKAIIAHLRTGNATNAMATADAEIDAYLIKNRSQ